MRDHLRDTRSGQLGQEDMVSHVGNRSPCARVAPFVAEFTDGTDHITPGAKRIQAKLCPVGSRDVATG